MDGGATATEHLLGMIDDSGSTGLPARRPACPAHGAEWTGQRSRRRTPPASRTKGSLPAQEVGGHSVLTGPSTRATSQAGFRVLAAVGEVLMATARTPTGDL
jgi:hypothetical protein